jgi:methyl-accepting chemotaxis protein
MTMRNPFTQSLTGKLTASFICASVIPLVILGWLSLRGGMTSLENASLAQLEAVRELHKQELAEYLQGRVNAIRLLAASPATENAFDQLVAYHDSGGGTPEGPFDVATAEYQAIHDRVAGYLKEYLDVSGDADLYYLCAAHGHVMFTVAEESDLGTNLSSGPHKDSGLARLWAQVVSRKEVSLVDYAYYAPRGEPAMFFGAPVWDASGDLRGVVAVQLSSQYINAMLLKRAGMGNTGESFLVGEDFLMRSNSWFKDESTILKQKMETDAAKAALDGKTDSEIVADYRGVEVLSAYCPVGLKKNYGADFDWALISKIDVREAFAPVYSLLIQVAWIGVVIALLAAVAGYFAARGIAGPIRRVSELAGQVSEGDLTVEVSANAANRSDEVGRLTGSFGKMVEALRSQTADIAEAASVVSSSSSEIAASAQEQVTGMTESATSITQITTAAEQFKATMQEFADRAGAVQEAAEETGKRSDEGRALTQQSLHRIEQVRSNAQAAGESVLDLSQQMERINEITASVNEIAEQTKLLSLNASIEAARAGEEGRGFAVVATQVRELANQSKEAARRIEAIIGETQQSMETVVAKIEEGSRLSEESGEIARQVRGALDEIATAVHQTMEAMRQIAAGARDQERGIIELAEGIGQVETASTEALAAAQQTQKAMMAIDRRIGALNESISKFKT